MCHSKIMMSAKRRPTGCWPVEGGGLLNITWATQKLAGVKTIALQMVRPFACAVLPKS